MRVGFIVVTAIVGAVVMTHPGGLIAGAVIGYLLEQIGALKLRIARLEQSGALPVNDAAIVADRASDTPVTPAQRAMARAAQPIPAEPAQPQAPIAAVPATSPRVSEPVAPTYTRAHEQPAAAEQSANIELPPFLKRFIADGNWAVRLGVVILFFGVAFLLKYAAEHVQVPIQVRLMGVALGALALLAFGWRLRHRRAAYALALQGGGVGVLYLNLFGALRLYQLLPAGAAFAMMAAIAAFSAALAVMQNARSLAMLGMAGGFLAPILTSSGGGSHVMLFSYYALLNAGIVSIAWFRAWRELNLLGFTFTFVIAAAWGYLSYRPEHLASTEPFLILFFAFYLAVAILFSLRPAGARRGFIDGSLVFGTPIVAFSMQAALMRDTEYGLGWSALVLAAVYLTIASILWRGRIAHRRFIVEAFYALGIVFFTLTFPLMLDGRWTAAAWALEGAGIAWVGIRQRHGLMQVFGVFVQLAAGVAFLLAVTPDQSVPFANRFFVGGILIALVGFLTSFILQRDNTDWRNVVGGWLFAWSVLWWFGTFWAEVQQQAPSSYRIAAHVAVTALSALAAAFAAQRWSWRWFWWPALALLPALLPYGAWALFAHGHLWTQGALVWPAALGIATWILYRAEAQGAPVTLLHAMLVWWLTAIATIELLWWINERGLGESWQLAAWALPALVMSYFVTRTAMRSHWPFATQRMAYLYTGLVPLMLGLLMWSLRSNLSGGDTTPLAYLPLVNPIDLINALGFFAAAYWFSKINSNLDGATREMLMWLTGLSVFLWANAVLLRSMHHYAEVAYRYEALYQSVGVQAALSIFWSVCALAAMFIGRQRQWRPLWVIGAVLLGVVVVKLFAVDLSNTGTVARIVSFMGVGVLLLLIGYVAPVPPRVASETRS